MYTCYTRYTLGIPHGRGTSAQSLTSVFGKNVGNSAQSLTSVFGRIRELCAESYLRLWEKTESILRRVLPPSLGETGGYGAQRGVPYLGEKERMMRVDNFLLWENPL